MAWRGESVRMKISRPRQCGQIRGSLDGARSAPGGTSGGTTKSGGGSNFGVAWSCNICLTRSAL